MPVLLKVLKNFQAQIGYTFEMFVCRKVSRSVSIPPILEGDTDIGEMEDEEDREGERRKR